MSSVGLFSIGGLASGLDTATMVTQLMQLEKLPVTRMQSAQQQLRARDDAWGQVNTRLSALRAAVDKINRPDRFTNLVKVTSSNDASVGVTARPGAATGSLTFSVSQLAQAHQIRTDTVGDPTAALGGTSFSVTQAGSTVDVDLSGGKSLNDVARELNAAKAGFTASVVQVGENEHRLIVSATRSGTANEVTLTTDATAGGSALGFADLQAAANARVTMGSGDGAVTITRSSNTIDDLVPGASITLRKVTAAGEAPVTVSSELDVDGAVGAVKEYVTALNAAIDTLARFTSYNAESKTGGALQGDNAARQMLSQLRASVAAPTGLPAGNGSLHSAFQIGLSVDRFGAVKLDEAKLKTALTGDFDGVARLFGAGGSASVAEATNVVGTARTAPGKHEVVISRAAAVARVTGAAFSPPGETEPKSFRITTGARTVSVTIDSTTTTPEQAALLIAEKLAEAGVTGLQASATPDGAIELSTTRFGAAATFTVEAIDEDGEVIPGDDVFGLAGTHAGLDVEGTIGGVAATGAGRTLTGAAGTAAAGLSLTWSGAGPSEGAFEVTVSRGLGGSLSDVLRTMEGSGGSVARARQGLTSQIKIYQDRIDGFDVRLATRESTLRRQFTAMETALAQLHSQGNWLASQLSGLNALHQ